MFSRRSVKVRTWAGTNCWADLAWAGLGWASSLQRRARCLLWQLRGSCTPTTADSATAKAQNGGRIKDFWKTGD